MMIDSQNIGRKESGKVKNFMSRHSSEVSLFIFIRNLGREGTKLGVCVVEFVCGVFFYHKAGSLWRGYPVACGTEYSRINKN